MRDIVWFGWCMVLGAMLSGFGISFVDHPFWFLAVDICFIIASWHMFNIIWPRKKSEEE